MKRLIKFLISVFTGVMLLSMTAFASEYSVTPANAVFYTNGATVVLADAAENAQVILPECEAGLPIQVTGVTSNGYWQIVLGDATYYVVGAGLSQTAESEVSASKPAQAQSSSEFPYELLKRYVTPDGKISYFYCTEDCSWKTHGWHQVWYTCNNYNNVTFGHEMASGRSYETTMSTFTICDDMDGYKQAATANGLVARQSAETPWKTADGKKIRVFCP